jgi:Trk-type K+ transport system membrane component
MNYNDRPAIDQYVTSVYFTVTTVLTVGYGDIRAFSNFEKLFCMILMIFGVISFSYSTGALSTIIQSVDSRDAQLKEKIAVLNEIKNQYKLDSKLFNKLVRTIQYDNQKKQKDFSQFMEELPCKLRDELKAMMHQKMY